MNLLLLFPDDFVSDTRARVGGRRLEAMHRIGGATFRAGVAGGRMGTATVVAPGEVEVDLDSDPPRPLPLTLVLALPRPKVLNRTVAAAVSMGIKRIVLINAWKVEKSYWRSPRLAEQNLREQAIAGLEQARDTLLPEISLRRLFRPFAEEELPAIAAGSLALVADPIAKEPFPSARETPVTLAIGPEGGWIDAELRSFERAGFRAVSLGPRVLRVETAVAFAAARVM